MPELSRRAQLTDNELRAFLREARSEWRVSQVIVAENKLNRMGINSVNELVAILKADGHLDELCSFHGEKAFPEEIVNAWVAQSSKIEPVVPAAPPTSQLPAPVRKPSELKSVAAEDNAPKAREKGRPVADPPPEVLPPATASRAAVLLPAPARPEATQPLPAASVPPVLPNFSMEERQQKIQEMKQRCQAQGLNMAWAEQMAEEELKKEHARRQQFANWKRKKPPEKIQHASEQRKQAENVEWFCVVFSKVFVKKAPDEKSKSWGFVYKGQTLEVLSRRASDDRGRAWVELTPFELWRSCLRNGSAEQDTESRAFCLIDAADMKLGALLSGPLPRTEWPVLSDDELREFSVWSGEVPRRLDSGVGQKHIGQISSGGARNGGILAKQETHDDIYPWPSEVQAKSEQEHSAPKPAPCSAKEEEMEKFQLLQDLSIHVNPDLKPRVLGSTVTDPTDNAEIAAMPDLRAEDSEEVKEVITVEAGLKMAKGGMLSKMLSRDRDAAHGCTLNVQHRLREALANADQEVSLMELQASIAWAKAYSIQEEIIIMAEKKLAELEEEGEYGRMARQARVLLSKAKTEPELRSVIEHCESTDLGEVAEEARATLRKFIDEQASQKSGHAEVLEWLKAAIALGNAAEVKAARDAAKAAGVPKKELARVFALAQD